MKYLSFLPVILLILSCSETSTTTAINSTDVIFIPDSSDSGKIFIRDHTGKEWDITHAVFEYGFESERFRHGLGPYAIRPILAPRFIDSDDSEFQAIDENEMVIGTVINGLVRAYSLKILKNHEIVDERFGNTHVAVGYWPLVNLTAVYSREIDGNILTLSASGWTYQNTFVLYDYETESLWYHMSGENGLTCISGFYADRHLPELESTQIRWTDWVNNHPETKYLIRPTTIDDD